MQQGYNSCKSASCNDVAVCTVIAGAVEKTNNERDGISGFGRTDFVGEN